MLGGYRPDQEVEGDGGLQGHPRSHALGGGVQEMFGQKAEMLPARVVKGAGRGEAHIEEDEGRGGAGRGRQGRCAVGVRKQGEGRWRR